MPCTVFFCARCAFIHAIYPAAPPWRVYPQVVYFAFQIVKEVLRTALDLEEVRSEEVLRLLETRVWPAVAYAEGAVGTLARAVFVRVVLFLERRVSGRRRAGTIARTRARLDARLQEVVRAANWRERVRRAANVTSWVLQGLVDSPEVAAEVARYEARGRTGEEGPWAAAAAEGARHRRGAVAAALREARDVVGLELLHLSADDAPAGHVEALLRAGAARLSRRLTGSMKRAVSAGGLSSSAAGGVATKGEADEAEAEEDDGGDEIGGLGEEKSSKDGDSDSSWADEILVRPSADDRSWRASPAHLSPRRCDS